MDTSSEQMIRALLIVGIADDDIILVVLGQSDQDMPLDITICFMLTKGSGKRSSGRINHNPTVTIPSKINTTRCT